MCPSFIASWLVMSVCVLVDFETQNDLGSDDDAIDERVRLSCVDASIVDAIFSLSHVDVMLLEEAEERVLVFLARQASRLIGIAREAILFSIDNLSSHGTRNTIISETYFILDVNRIFWFTLGAKFRFLSRKTINRISISTLAFLRIDVDSVFWFTFTTKFSFLSRKSEDRTIFSTETFFMNDVDRIFRFALTAKLRFFTKKTEVWLRFSTLAFFIHDIDRVFRLAISTP
ncbi:hypothetical protein NY2A_b105L [Paramecium bursaria Chlorella virus NY2A]|uniref:Uncharacterized protein b105L n=1 Tax=Paramecium bursaria Chlorella virus NY2A TaxID=46021 RepID=A7IVY0_PBCVN|nr:hypothetical protein NY2A_b105L [Paramecium bursaria Chlorella virus NY2A]ABT14504.1 hypothetical protein NY2A_b105L [Paramecium bursaria Chlorella virus NY2A]